MIIGGIEVPVEEMMHALSYEPTALELAENQRDRIHLFCAVHSFLFLVSWLMAMFFFEYLCITPLIFCFFAIDYRRQWHKRQRNVQYEIVREVLES